MSASSKELLIDVSFIKSVLKTCYEKCHVIPEVIIRCYINKLDWFGLHQLLREMSDSLCSTMFTSCLLLDT